MERKIHRKFKNIERECNMGCYSATSTRNDWKLSKARNEIGTLGYITTNCGNVSTAGNKRGK